MIGIEQLKRRADELQPIVKVGNLTDSQIAVRAMSDEEIEQRAREIMAKELPDDASAEERALRERVRHIMEHKDQEVAALSGGTHGNH